LSYYYADTSKSLTPRPAQSRYSLWNDMNAASTPLRTAVPE